jgi:hypothetical protein
MHKSIGLAFLTLLTAAPLAAQEAAAPAPAPGAPAAAPSGPVPEPKLVFDREVYSYSGERRRDPFTKLVGKAGLGPRFEDLTIRGIIFASGGGQSVALLVDAVAKKVYKVRKGDLVGNSRVVDIQPNGVMFSVENFGQFRQEMLEYKTRKTEGAKG